MYALSQSKAWVILHISAFNECFSARLKANVAINNVSKHDATV